SPEEAHPVVEPAAGDEQAPEDVERADAYPCGHGAGLVLVERRAGEVLRSGEVAEGARGERADVGWCAVHGRGGEAGALAGPGRFETEGRRLYGVTTHELDVGAHLLGVHVHRRVDG